MQIIRQAYHRLLIDVSNRSGVSLDAPEHIDMDWILNEAPDLDKRLLVFLRDGGNCPCFPTWLMPLVERFLSQRQGSILKDIRQLLVFGYKAEHEPRDEQLKTAQAAFVDTDEVCGVFDSSLTADHLRPLLHLATALIGRVIYRINYAEIRPSHGPGAVFPSCDPSEKSNFQTIYPTIDELYPYFDFFGATSSRISEALERDKDLIIGDNIIAKLVAVPKDSRGPRLICVHPKEAVWIQQGLRKELERAITQSPLTRGYINFDDQMVNGMLALTSSADGRYATIDLKEASDRISLGLFRTLFGGAAKWFECCRATHIRLLDGSLHMLQKFAPMGNATVFPTESLIFWAVARAGIRCYTGRTRDDIYVFGDDLIVPSEYYGYVIKALVRVGLVPNLNKCFYRGLFRESCGVDAFNGVNVTPHRIKKWRMSSLSDLVSICALAKNMSIDGYLETSAYMYSCVRQCIGHLPLCNDPYASGIYEYVERDIGFIMRNEPTLRWNNSLHRYEVRLTRAVSVKERTRKHDWYHVLDSLLRRKPKGDLPNPREVGYAFPRRSRPSRGWTQVRYSPMKASLVRGAEEFEPSIESYSE